MKNIYFIGIGGIGMSALARFFKHQGYQVAGYDRTSTPLTATLEAEGVEVHYEDNVALIPKKFRDPKTTRVVYTPAVSNDHTELMWFRIHSFEVVKRSATLGLLCQGKQTMAVAGTHGKSTTSTLVAWLNYCASTDGSGSAFLGAISKNFHTNMVLGEGARIAVEADEFDRSFLQLSPFAALVTACDPDHLDIYGTQEAFHEAFLQFISQVQGPTIVKYGLDLPHTYTYSLDNPDADYYARNIVLRGNGHYLFDLVLRGGRVIEECTLGIPGLVNVENAVGAVALVDQMGFDTHRLRVALSDFQGIERRFDFWINTPRAVYVDDYAHHPTELTAFLGSLRSMYPDRHLTVCFQPHLYTRTRDFAAGFSAALSLADRVILLPIYPAREAPIEGVSSEMLLEGISVEKQLCPKADLAQTLKALPTDVVATVGAGDIDLLRKGVYEVIEKKDNE